jgi:hypothetical protein
MRPYASRRISSGWDGAFPVPSIMLSPASMQSEMRQFAVEPLIAPHNLPAQMAVRVTRLPLGRVAEEPRDVRLPFHVRLTREVEIAAIGHRLAGERILQILKCLASIESHFFLLLPCMTT